MQQKTLSMKVPIGIKAMAEMMAMEEVEVRFFPKLDDLRSLLKDYNFGTPFVHVYSQNATNARAY